MMLSPMLHPFVCTAPILAIQVHAIPVFMSFVVFVLATFFEL